MGGSLPKVLFPFFILCLFIIMCEQQLPTATQLAAIAPVSAKVVTKISHHCLESTLESPQNLPLTSQNPNTYPKVIKLAELGCPQ